VILTGPEIARHVTAHRTQLDCGGLVSEPFIDIDPFNPEHVGPNSYDLTLAPQVVTYDLGMPTMGSFGVTVAGRDYLDARVENPTKVTALGPDGGLFVPGALYLCSTVERTACAGFVPSIETRSSLARLGVSCHLSAGWGDDGFDGQWTLEITVVHPVILYPGMRVCQVAFSPTVGERKPYKGKYQLQVGPVPSKCHEDSR
jgi:dCTP deaminase